MFGIDSVVSFVALALDAAALRQQAIANNIANVGSVGYVPLRVNFEEQLAFARGDPTGAAVPAGARPFIEADTAGATAVMLDVEMVKLAQNAVHYQSLLKALDKHLSIMSAAVNEGRR
jgi:flagellar basal-body rod protein FlgB